MIKPVNREEFMKHFELIQKKRESKKLLNNDKLNEKLKTKEKDNNKKDLKVEENNMKAKINMFNNIQNKSNNTTIRKSTNNDNDNLKKSINNSNKNIPNQNNIVKNNKESKNNNIKNNNEPKNEKVKININNNNKKVTEKPEQISKQNKINNINNPIETGNQLTKSKNNNNISNNTSNNNINSMSSHKNSEEIKNANNINKSDIEKNKIKKVKSFNNYRCKNNILVELLQKDPIKENKKKSKSFKNKIGEMDIDNFLIKNKKIHSLYDDKEELDEVMQIDDEKNRKTQKELTRLKRTKTSAHESNKKEEIVMKKRHSLLGDNNSLAIKLPSKETYTKDDFEVITFLGKGAYGTVLQVSLKKDPKKIYAIKKLDIYSLFSVNRLYQAYLENDILRELDSPYIVKIYGAFESDAKIHLIMDFLPKGDLSYFIKNNTLKDDIIKFYTAEMVLFLEYMQSKNLVHRDLKPQNIMIDEKGHLKVIDFGTVRKLGYYYDKRDMKFKEEKVFEQIDSEDIKGVKNIVNPDEEDADADDYDDDEDEEDEDDEDNNENENEISEKKKKRIQKLRVKRSMTFVGTAEYISPEVIGDRPAEFGTDIWAVGVMLYEMYFNTTPFKAVTTYLTFRNIEKPQINFPKDKKIKEEAKDLILKMLVAEPKKRLGGGEPKSQYDIAHLKKHSFFKGIKWNNLHNMNPPGIKNYKYYECKKKSIYKNQEKKDISDGYAFFEDNSRKSNIKIIKEGIIQKKSAWFHYEKKKIVLDTTPRIILTSLNDPKNIREIPLNKKCKVTIVDTNCFDLKANGKTHRFKKNSGDENNWADLIFETYNQYGME